MMKLVNDHTGWHKGWVLPMARPPVVLRRILEFVKVSDRHLVANFGRVAFFGHEDHDPF